MNIKECHVKFYQSQRRFSYIHLCKNTKANYQYVLNMYTYLATFNSFALESIFNRTYIQVLVVYVAINAYRTYA